MKQANAYKYCPRCGKDLSSKSSRVLVCSNNHELYINPKATTAAVISAGSKILLVKRAREPYKGFWDLPGGFIEQKESAEQSLVRELKEELNITVNPNSLRYITSAYGQYKYMGVVYPTLAFGYLYIPKSTLAIKSQDDVECAEYFSPKTLPMKHIAFKECREILTSYLHKTTT